jgi:hypothetical protein
MAESLLPVRYNYFRAGHFPSKKTLSVFELNILLLLMKVLQSQPNRDINHTNVIANN